MSNRKPNGMALITMLMVISFALLLLGSFFHAEKSALDVLRGADRQANRINGLETVFEFCRFQLEKDRSWGSPADGASTGEYAGVLEWQIKTTSGDSGLVEGKLSQSGLDFRVEVLNNIHSNDVGPEDVPGRTIRLRIFVSDQRERSGAEVYLHKAPLYDASMVASETIQVQADKINLNSVDPIHNRIRSLEGTTLPPFGASDPPVVFRSNEVDSGRPPAVKGSVWSKGAIDIGSYVTLDEAEESTGGRFVENANKDYIPTQIEFQDLKPDPVGLPGGDYLFDTTRIEYYDGSNWILYDGGSEGDELDVLIYSNSSSNKKEMYFSRDQLQDNVPDNAEVRIAGDPQSVGYPEQDTFFLVSGMKVDLPQARITISSDAQVDLRGDTQISGNGDTVPVIQFGTPPEDSYGNWHAEDGGVIVIQGNLSLRGVITGQGSVICSSNINLAPTSLELATDTETELALFASGVISFKSLAAMPGPAVIRGLVYSGADIIIEGQNDQLLLEGAMVAPDGNLDITGLSELEVIYNPAFLDIVLEDPEESGVDLDTVSWRSL